MCLKFLTWSSLLGVMGLSSSPSYTESYAAHPSCPGTFSSELPHCCWLFPSLAAPCLA